MDSASPDTIFNSFTASTKEDWKKAAQVELDGADPFQKLIIKKAGLAISPYYDHEDRTGKKVFQLKPSSNEFLGARAWYNMPLIEIEDEAEANKKALSELNSGADGIFFKLRRPAISISRLLENIEWPYCAINFTGTISDSFLTDLHKYATERQYNVASLTGCIFHEKQDERNIEVINYFEHWKHFHAMGITAEPKERPAEEIANALFHAVQQIEITTGNGMPVPLAIHSISFHFQIEEDFFLQLSKLKVIRILWQNIKSSYGENNSGSTFIHASSLPWNKKEYEPNGNMLKSTSAALSGILGGCDGLTIVAEEQDAMKNRIARNVSNVLREESHLSLVADPTAGSYFLDSIIEQLALKAWQTFIKKVNA